MKKILRLCFVLCFVSLFMVGCVPPWVERQSPIHFLGATWESEDGLVRFTVNMNTGEYHCGSVKKGDALVEMIFESAVSWFGMQGCSVDEYKTLLADEYGIKNLSHAKSYESYDFVEQKGQEHYFIAEVYDSSIYEKGEQITFYRVDETKDVEVKEFSLENYETQIKNHTSNIQLDSAKDIKSAVSQARSVLEREFGTLSDDLEVYYDSSENYWLVKGKHWLEPVVSVPYIIFNINGDVSAIWE